jgi:PAS domain S-box-containing protein
MNISHTTSFQSPAQNGEDNGHSVITQTLHGLVISSDRTPDMADRKQVEEQLQFQAAILRYVTDSVIVTDLLGTITYWNEGASAVFGYTATEMIGKTLALLSFERDMDQNVDDFKRIQAGDDYIGEWQGRRKDGTTVWVDVKTTILHDTQGTAIGLIGISKDITARREAEERLRQSEKHFRALVENMDGGITLTDANGIMTYVSPSTTRMEGFLPEELMGHRVFTRMVYPADQEATARLWARVIEEPGKSHTLEYRSKCKNGSFLWIEVVGRNLLHEPGIEAIVWNYRDVSERKQLEQRKDHFISMVSHELKTPLTVLSAYTQLLRERCVSEGRTDTALHLSKMNDQITNLTKLVVDMLDISKMQAGQIEMAREAVDMDTLAHEVVESLQPTTSHHLLIEGEARGTITGDRERLGQVMMILLDNAIKYSPQADTVVVRIARAREGDTLTVAVQDCGIGIGQEHQGRLFERFYRALSKKDKTYPGLGIGLYIAHEIIQHHGGKMWVESNEGSGSIFFFSLPA